jgi:hypothetical protein
VACQSYQFGEAEVAVRTTSHEFAEWMDEVFSQYRAEHDVEPAYSVVIGGGSGNRSGRGYHILYRGILPVVRTLDLPTLARGIMAEFESAYFHERSDALFLRQATVDIGGRAALISSFLAVTLGTLGRKVQKAGVTLPVTDFTAVDLEEGSLVPTPPALDLPADAVDRLAALGSGNGSADRLVIEGALSPEAVLITFGTQLVEPVSRGVALHQLAASALNLSVVGQRGLDALARLVSGTRCYRLGGDAQLQLEFLGSGSAVGA